MKTTKRIISVALAAMMAVSAFAFGASSASAASLKKPTGVKATNTMNAIQVKWSKVSGAKKYKVYRNNKLIRTTAKLSTKDFSVNAGTVYNYKVKAVNGKKTSAASAAAKIKRINFSDFRSLTNTTNGVRVSWHKRHGATKYVLYRKSGSGSFTKVTSTKTNVYVDKDVTSGTRYTYQVACYDSATKTFSARITQRALTYLAQPTGLVAREAGSAKSVELNWNSVKGAKTYEVYRESSTSKGFVKVATTSATSYSDTDVPNNPAGYMYKVKAVNVSTSFASDERIVLFAPKRDGVNSYYFMPDEDADNDGLKNLHIVLNFSVGEKYYEGKLLADFISANGLYNAEVIEGKDVVSIDDSVITAEAEGSAIIKLTVNDECKALLDEFGNKGAIKTASRVVYLMITVE